MRNKTRSERGQVLILLTVGVITLLGFTALAIDGGRVYSERRNIQGISDTSSMTGALYIAQEEGAITSAVLDQAIAAALNRAERNGYSTPEVAVSITQDGSYYYVETTIHTTVQPTIVRLVYDGPLSVAATSTARVEKVSVFAMGQALFSLNKSACESIYFHGNAGVIIEKTGIFSNSNCPDSAIHFQGSTTADITGSIIHVPGGGIEIQKPGDVNYGGQVQDDPVDFTKPNEPDCSDLDDKSVSGSSLSSGVYPTGIKLSGNGSWTMDAGLYCLDGDFSVTNGELIGNGVTIFMRSGAFRINGGAVELTAPSSGEWLDGSEKPWNGMLVFYAYSNDDILILNGNADSYFEGTFFNYSGECQLNGTGNTRAYDAQFVCDTIDLIGNSDLNITYNPETKYPPPTVIDLVE